MNAHPYADKFPMLADAEHAELVESIRANGLRNPVIVTADGLILDGRNRAKACAEIGVEPETVVYEGDDLAEYVIDCNVTRRNMTTGARAMSTALVLAADGRRQDGRWKRGSVVADPQVADGWAAQVSRAGVVLDFAPDLASAVVAGDLALDAAFRQANEARQSEQADELARKARERSEREQAKAEAERNAQIINDLTDAGATKYLALIEDGTFKPAAAWAAQQEDTRKEREAERQLDMGRKSTCTRIAECVRYLDGGHEYAAIFLADFYPHEHRFLAEPMRLDAERIDSAIDFLTAIRKGIEQ